MIKTTKILNKISSIPINVKHISAHKNVEEVRIPMPIGYLTGKWWGPFNQRPIVAFHGWQDNCGSFDRLIPLLPEYMSVLALDCPGHGHSYKLPPGIPYHNSDFPILIKQLMNYFNWKKITLMGHSLGAILSYTYGYLFPKDIDFLICIDGLHPIINPKKTQRIILSIEQFLKYDALQQKNEEPPCYTIEEMIQRLHLATRKSIAVEVAKHILCRNIAPSKKYPGKYYFNRDARLKVGPLEIVDSIEIVKCAASVHFPIFISKAMGSSFFGNEAMFKEVYGVLKKTSSDCQFHEIPGTHHVHLNDPDVLAGLITEFIKKHYIFNGNLDGLKPEIIHNKGTIDLEKSTEVQL